MHYLFAKAVPLFIPAVPTSVETFIVWPFIYILYYVELVFIIIMCPGAVLFFYTLANARKLFHRNLIRIAQGHLLIVVMSQVSRIYIIIHDVGVVKRKDSANFTLFILYLIRYVPMCSFLTMVPAIAAERTFASKYISDYERKDRLWISYLANGGSIVLAANFYLLVELFFIGMVAMVPFTILTLSFFIISSVAIQMVYKRDAAKLRDLANETGRSTISYTLSMKFQLAENVRVAKWLFYASIGYSIWGLCGLLLCIPCFLILSEDNPVAQLLFQILNVYISLSFAVVAWICPAAMGNFRRILYKLLSCCTNRVTNVDLNTTIINDNIGSASEHYFKQLKSAWE